MTMNFLGTVLIRPHFLGLALLASAVSAALSPAVALEKTIRVPADHPTIAKAIETAAAGDTVMVAPGTYNEILFMKDGVVLASEKGQESTTIVYGDPAGVEKNENEAVVSLQKCGNSTQVVGFTIDGRSVAKRGILAVGGLPVISNCRVKNAQLAGIGISSNAAPYVQFTRVESCSLAACFVQGGSGDIRECEFVGSKSYGLLVSGTGLPLKVRNCRITGCSGAGIQATEGDFTVTGGVIAGNHNGIVLDLVRPVFENVVIESSGNIGAIFESSPATLQRCTVRNNKFGLVISGAGDARIHQTTFEDNTEFHISVEGDAIPVIGGSIENANLFVGKSGCSISSQARNEINAAFNYWGRPFPSKDQFKVLPGGAQVRRKPWVTADLKNSFTDFEAARKHSRTPLTEAEAAQAASDLAQSEATAAADAAKKAADAATTPTPPPAPPANPEPEPEKKSGH